MARAAANVVIPDRLFQRGQFLTWSKRQKQRLLGELGITVVCNLWAKIDPDIAFEENTNRMYIQWHTSPSVVPDDAETVIPMLAGLLRNGHRMLIHCEAGRGRSVWLSARVLAEYAGIPRIEALAQVLAAVPNADLTPTLLEDLK
jgi:protein-tyrosine phosphatase